LLSISSFKRGNINMTLLTNIKEGFQSNHADQIAAIRCDVERLHTDLVALHDDLLNNEAAVKRRRKRPGSELRAHSFIFNDSGRDAAREEVQKMRRRKFSGVAIASAIVATAGVFAIWSSRNATAM
jgi:hypothetical protein